MLIDYETNKKVNEKKLEINWHRIYSIIHKLLIFYDLNHEYTDMINVNEINDKDE